MRSFFTFISAIFLCLFAFPANAQTADEQTVSSRPWSAYWIAPPNDPGTTYGVYYFRKNIDLTTRPESFIVKVSADNRYKLYVNDTLVSVGPSRGDTYYWNYETIDLAPYLKNREK